MAAVTLALVMATAALAGGRPLSASPMTGAQEVPPADPDGSGTASVWLNEGQGTVCFSWAVEDIALPVTGSHIHLAPAGVAGGVVVPLTGADADGVASDCVSADPGLIKQIRQNPAGYYVNVHNAEFPGGAVRGQLSK